MSKEAMKLALEAFREIAKIDWHDGLKGLDKPTDFAERQAAIFALGGAKTYALRVIRVLEEALAKQEGQSNFCPQCEALARELKAVKQEQGEVQNEKK